MILTETDTIVAISTPFGIGGLGIVRMSGERALSIAEKIFKPKNPKKIVSQLSTFTTHLGYIIDNDGVIIDEVLMTLMRAPHSYTCEDVVEFSCHGGPVILKKIVEICIKNGARLAEPGEFTKRAFLNGRIDLSQAEAVCDLIYAKSELQSKLYAQSLLGKTKKSILDIVEKIKEVIAEIEVCIDYPDEDDVQNVNFNECKNKIIEITKEISSAVEFNEKIYPILTSVNIAIVGKVNVGKSSLLNILLDNERAIVSEIPGTTRDAISETININGIPIRIVDTAGIRQHLQDPIEEIGIKHTKQAVNDADIILFLFDATQNVSQDDIIVKNIILESLENNRNKKVIPLVNKVDKGTNILTDEQFFDILRQLDEKGALFPPYQKDLKVLQISCLTKYGIKELQEVIINCLQLPTDKLESFVTQDAPPVLITTNIRQTELLKNAYDELKSAVSVDINLAPEIVCEHLKNAVNELSKITGGGDISEDILNIIFSRFCVGK